MKKGGRESLASISIVVVIILFAGILFYNYSANVILLSPEGKTISLTDVEIEVNSCDGYAVIKCYSNDTSNSITPSYEFEAENLRYVGREKSGDKWVSKFNMTISKTLNGEFLISCNLNPQWPNSDLYKGIDYSGIKKVDKKITIGACQGSRTNLIISNLNPSSYKLVDSLVVGNKYYTDKNYVIKTLPDFLNSCKAIKTSNNNRRQVSFSVDKPVQVYLAWDTREKTPSGWTSTTDKIYVSDKPASKGGYLQLLKKDFSVGKVVVPKKNLKSNYIIFACSSGVDDSSNAIEFTNINISKEIEISEDKFRIEWVTSKDVSFYLLSIIKIGGDGTKTKEMHSESFGGDATSYEIDFTEEPFLSEGNGRYLLGLTAVTEERNYNYGIYFRKE